MAQFPSFKILLKGGFQSICVYAFFQSSPRVTTGAIRRNAFLFPSA